ncbi:MAG TPA: GIY-YIG nuclease family protein [Candidatus Binatus sp.]|nr:GIY-YIG nuclease family protein [Candidatus Binatus sp.]
MSLLRIEHSRNAKPLANARAAVKSMGCFVYVLGSSGPDGYRTYVGWTNDLERRIARHNAGTGARSTRGRVWFLLYAERHDSRGEAMSREWHLKRNRTFRKRLMLQ